MTDLYTPDFPHGTAEGFDLGCKGGACQYSGDPDWLSCKEAAAAIRSDYQMRNHSRLERIPRTGGAIKVQHGTQESWKAGCTVPTDCPNHDTSKPTCWDAHQIHLYGVVDDAPAVHEADAPAGFEVFDRPKRAYRRWTDEAQAELLDLHSQGLTTQQIADAMERGKSFIGDKLKLANLTPNHLVDQSPAEPSAEGVSAPPSEAPPSVEPEPPIAYTAPTPAAPAGIPIAPDSTDGPVPDPVTHLVEQPPAEGPVTLPAGGNPDHDGPLFDVRSCRVCGCTDDDCSGCIERTGAPCSWVDDDLCSACTPDALRTLAQSLEDRAAALAKDAVTTLETQLADLQDEYKLETSAHTETLRLLGLAQTRTADLEQRILSESRRPAEVATVGTGGESPTALAEVTSGPQQLELTVAQTDQGTRLQLSMPTDGSTAELRIVDGAVSVLVGR